MFRPNFRKSYPIRIITTIVFWKKIVTMGKNDVKYLFSICVSKNRRISTCSTGFSKELPHKDNCDVRFSKKSLWWVKMTSNVFYFYFVNLCVLIFNYFKIRGPTRYCHIDSLTSQIGQTLKLNGQLTFFVKWKSFAEKYITLGSFLQKKYI